MPQRLCILFVNILVDYFLIVSPSCFFIAFYILNVRLSRGLRAYSLSAVVLYGPPTPALSLGTWRHSAADA